MATVRVFTELTALETMVVSWQRLVDRTVGATVYQTPEWASAWLRTGGKASVPFGIALFEGARLVGFAPLSIESVWGVRVLRFMGGDLNDFNCVLAEPAYTSHMQTVVAKTLGEHLDTWDVTALTGLGDSDSLAHHVHAQLGMPAALTRLRTDALPRIALPDTWQEYFSALSNHRRKKLGKALRGLQGRGELSFQVLTRPDELADELGIFFAARMENWRASKRLHSMVAVQRTPRYWSTLTDICMELADRGRVWLGRLAVDDIPVAWDLAFVTNGIVADYMTTYDLRFARYSPGFMISFDLIRHSIEQGAHTLLLGRGAQPYKFWLGAAPARTENLLVFVNRPRAQAYVGMQLLRERAQETAHDLRTNLRKFAQEKENGKNATTHRFKNISQF